MTSAVILWWVLSGLSVIFVLADWHHAPIDLTMHVGFVLIVAFMGPLGALMYVLTVREPLPGTHEAYIAPRWKQVVGSTFHCVSGDSVGIVGIAVLTPWLLSHVDPTLEIVLEYAAGFLVGWLIFQALFMKDMAGGSYLSAVRSMFMPEWISMNGVMAGMALVMVFWLRADAGAADPLHGDFWLMMSASLVAGAIVAYPFNWWLVARKLKHGLMSTADNEGYHGHSMASHAMHESRHDDGSATPSQHMSMPMPDGHEEALHRYRSPVVWASAASFVLALGVSYGIMR